MPPWRPVSHAPVATRLTTQLLVGSSALLAERGDPAALRAMVTSPGGTTAAGLAALEARALRAAFADAIRAATAAQYRARIHERRVNYDTVFRT